MPLLQNNLWTSLTTKLKFCYRIFSRLNNNRNHTMILLYAAIIVGTLAISIVSKSVWEERDLYTHLMNNYSKEIRPVKLSGTKTNISVHPTLEYLVKVVRWTRCHNFSNSGPSLNIWGDSLQDEIHESLTGLFWFSLIWHDEFLEWDPGKFHGIEEIRIPITDLWRPDIIVYGS